MVAEETIARKEFMLTRDPRTGETTRVPLDATRRNIARAEQRLLLEAARAAQAPRG